MCWEGGTWALCVMWWDGISQAYTPYLKQTLTANSTPGNAEERSCWVCSGGTEMQPEGERSPDTPARP